MSADMQTVVCSPVGGMVFASKWFPMGHKWLLGGLLERLGPPKENPRGTQIKLKRRLDLRSANPLS